MLSLFDQFQSNFAELLGKVFNYFEWSDLYLGRTCPSCYKVCLSHELFPFSIQWRQFPVEVCFGKTENEARIQTLSQIGFYLNSDYSSHGLLYISMSRVGNPKRLWSLTKRSNNKNITNNIVYSEVPSGWKYLWYQILKVIVMLAINEWKI